MINACYLPSPALSDYVSWYLLSNDTNTYAHWQEAAVMPNGLSALVFSYGAPFQYVTGLDSYRAINTISILGPHTKPCQNRWKDPISMFIIVFKPLGLYKLLGGNMFALKNEVVDLADYPFPESSWVCDELAQSSSTTAKIELVEDWLKHHLSGDTCRYSLTAYVLKYIIEHLGSVCIEDIVKKLNVNRRYLERQFNRQLGMSPKDYAETIRFSYITSKLAKLQEIDWPELTYLGKFYDQSHFIKHFKKHSNISPGEFRGIITQSEETKFASQINIFNTHHHTDHNHGKYITLVDKMWLV
ncbi:DUF6597 domain-containing transcriptional factor [Parapedobacter sp. 2B3]|uniref:DUF6597 domain-containing transcriptional factor n=1 Tax=Parapedobacter sp. 2B3 TaxID=3342381 RepID=UPI0035B584F3